MPGYQRRWTFVDIADCRCILNHQSLDYGGISSTNEVKHKWIRWNRRAGSVPTNWGHNWSNGIIEFDEIDMPTKPMAELCWIAALVTLVFGIDWKARKIRITVSGDIRLRNRSHGIGTSLLKSKVPIVNKVKTLQIRTEIRQIEISIYIRTNMRLIQENGINTSNSFEVNRSWINITRCQNEQHILLHYLCYISCFRDITRSLRFSASSAIGFRRSQDMNRNKSFNEEWNESLTWILLRWHGLYLILQIEMIWFFY